MIAINTNVSSLIARTSLGRSNADLQVAMTRLSTGLRINSGKDDPAGLIASEMLRSEIRNVEKAISNTERANQIIATAEGGLQEISNLLNDIRALITEAANTGGLTADEIAANQAVVDESLDAISRITDTVKFQGKGLLDGSMAAGAVFQLGPDVVAAQQITVTIADVDSTALGLDPIRTGGLDDLATDPAGAAALVDAAISTITTLRGDLGAIQRAALDTNINSLNDMLANLTESESAIRDADFAAETAKMTRAQILVQSGTAVLRIANQNPQAALALLQ